MPRDIANTTAKLWPTARGNIGLLPRKAKNSSAVAVILLSVRHSNSVGDWQSYRQFKQTHLQSLY